MIPSGAFSYYSQRRRNSIVKSHLSSAAGFLIPLNYIKEVRFTRSGHTLYSILTGYFCPPSWLLQPVLKALLLVHVFIVSSNEVHTIDGTAEN
jgi:hypothetical protein